MTPPNFPDGSRENPAIIPETDAPDGSQANPAMIHDDDDEEAPPLLDDILSDSGMQSLLQAMDYIQSQTHEEEESHKLRQKRRLEEEELRWDERRAKALKLQKYNTARRYALNLHSDFINQSQKQSNDKEEQVVKGKEKSLFQEAKEGIERRKIEAMYSGSDTSACEIEFKKLTLREAPTLMEMSARVLAKNSDAIMSLNLVPDHLKKKISDLVSDLGGVDTRFMELLIQDSPSEVFARNCVDLVEKDLVKILCECDSVNLKVLSLDLCGRAMTENGITEFLKRSPKGFPALTKLSLKGAFCLTDNAVALIAKSAPLLQFINLSECSFLSSKAVEILADEFGSTLRGLNIGGCQGIKPAHPTFGGSIRKFKNLEYLSVAGLESITYCHRSFVGLFTSWGSKLTALSLASCTEVTDTFICGLANHCPNLEALDISDLNKLTDESLQYIADGCRSLNSVRLTKNHFSDEAVAAFLEVCGSSLNELCLNNVRNVGEYTAIALAKVCRRLRFLDLSWCRKLKEEELRRILSSCLLLRSLKLFGWTQVTDEFLEELSTSQVHITGLKMKLVYAHLDDSFPSLDAKFF